MKPYLVLDTNIILLDAHNVLTLGKENNLIIPETVLDEIDSKKYSTDPTIRYQVREFFRIFTRKTRLPVERIGDLIIVPSLIDDEIYIETVSKEHYPKFDMAENDSRIIHIAKEYTKHFNGQLTLMTNDAGCSERAAAAGLNVVDLKFVEYKEREFVKELIVPNEVFVKLHNQLITAVDSEYEVQNYNYVFYDEYTGQTKLATIRNGYIEVIGKDTENELRRQDAAPMNTGQLFLSKAIQNPNVHIVVCEASAGTGKTLTAFSNAIQLVKNRQYGGIVYVRTSVDDVEPAEANGFRSGNEEKDAPFFTPVWDVMDFIVRRRYKDSKLKGKELEEFVSSKKSELLEEYNITVTTTLGLRGTTIKNRVVIIDEAQNYSKGSLQKTVTRFGENTKGIIIGSNKQIDHPYITKFTNGLSVLLDACTKEQRKVKLHAVPLERIVRSDIAEFAEEIFSK